MMYQTAGMLVKLLVLLLEITQDHLDKRFVETLSLSLLDTLSQEESRVALGDRCGWPWSNL